MKKQLNKIVKKTGLFSALIGISSMYAQTTYTFTSAGATGSNGPTTPQITAAYLATNLNGSVTVTGGVQSFTVPTTGPYIVTASGAQGGHSIYNGGLGSKMVGEFTFTAGQVLKIVIGQKGLNESGDNNQSGGGGGGSFVYTGATLYLAAGGGAGKCGYSSGIYNFPTADATTLTTGNSGSGWTIGSGGAGGTAGSGGLGNAYGGGGAGWLADGGDATSYAGNQQGFSNLANWLGGTAPVGGGDGGFGGAGAGGIAYGGGGGGGGYSGGGSGTDPGSGGGAGSFNSGINQINTAAINTGNGSVLITSLYSLNISQTATISCNGNTTAALSTTVNGGTAPFTYTWLPTGGSAATATALAAGIYTCLVQDAGALLTSSTFTVTQPAVLATGVSSLTNVSCNKGNDGVITVTVTGGTAPYSYTWSPTGGSTASATSLVPNNYTCVVRDANSCPVVSASAIISEPVGVIVFSNNTIICAGESANLTAFGATSYTWNTAATTSVIAVSPTVTTVYTVNATNGVCNYSATVTQTVNACTGINEITTSLISVYPNPNNGIVNISLTSALAQNSTLEIYDALGKLVVKQILVSELNEVNLSNLNNGMYTFKVLNNNNTVKIGKLIKQ